MYFSVPYIAYKKKIRRQNFAFYLIRTNSSFRQKLDSLEKQSLSKCSPTNVRLQELD